MKNILTGRELSKKKNIAGIELLSTDSVYYSKLLREIIIFIFFNMLQ